MPQAESNVVLSRPNSGAVHPDARIPVDSTERLERREDGSVWRVSRAAEDELAPDPVPRGYRGYKVGDVLTASRVDSEQDPDVIAKGGRPWYLDVLDQQAATDAAVETAADAAAVGQAVADAETPVAKPKATKKGKS